jgi:hypothetical protein
MKERESNYFLLYGGQVNVKDVKYEMQNSIFNSGKQCTKYSRFRAYPHCRRNGALRFAPYAFCFLT